MILVALGTQDKEFTRLLKKIDELIDRGIIKEEVVVQAGYTKYESKNMKIFDYVSGEEFNDLIDRANYVICHAGVGTIFDCMRHKKKIIAVTRLSEYKEHNNDHQIEIAKEFGRLNYIIPVYDVLKLEDAVKMIDTFKPDEYKSNNHNMVKLVEDFIDNNGTRSIKNAFIKNKEIIMYLIFGVLTTLISILTRIVLFHTVFNADNALDVQIATIISNVVGIIFAYFTNRKYVFESTNKNKLKEAFNFVTGRISTLLMDMFIMYVGVTLLKGNENVITILSQILVIVANYLISKLIVFKKEK